MKRNRFIVILVAMAMSMLLVQGALAADEDSSVGPEVAAEGSKLDELLASIEADRAAAVDDLVNGFATNEGTAEELRATLESASATKLAEIVQNAESLEDVSAILAGTEGILALGDLDRDYVLTLVTPCRIVDTRRGGGGVFFPGQVREFFVYGTTNIVNQGGNPAGCSSPKGEPRGVHINVTAVPQSAQGNFRAYPANVGAPNAAILNYKAGVQNVANAASVKTFFNIGTGGLKILNRVGTSHLVVDILGYYHEVDEGFSKYLELAGGQCNNSPSTFSKFNQPFYCQLSTFTASSSAYWSVNVPNGATLRGMRVRLFTNAGTTRCRLRFGTNNFGTVIGTVTDSTSGWHTTPETTFTHTVNTASNAYAVECTNGTIGDNAIGSIRIRYTRKSPY